MRKVWLPGQGRQYHLENVLEMHIMGPSPDLLIRRLRAGPSNLCLPSGWFW